MKLLRNNWLWYKPVRFLAALVLLSCVPALYIPSPEQAERAGIPLEDLKKGRQLYVEHCGSCHMLYLPKRFTTEKWKAELDTMRLRIPITEQEKNLILGYLLTGK